MSTKQIFPKEHGTWTMLLVPLAVGFGVARRFGLKGVLLTLGTLMFFLAQNQAMNRLRLRFATHGDATALARARALLAIFTAIGAMAMGPLLFYFHLTGLLYFGVLACGLTAISLILTSQKLDRSPAGQILASAGLSLSAPLAFYVALGNLNHVAFELWMMNFLFFLGGVFYVQMKINALARKAALNSWPAKFRFAGKTLAIETALLASAVLALRLGSVSPWILLGFVPTIFQAIAGTLRLDHPAKLKRVGVISTVHSILFAVAVIWLA